MNTSIEISFNSALGTRGSGVDQFEYPVGITYSLVTSQFYITDRQNQRTQIYDSSLVYVGTFGTYGTGLYQMNFPEGIVTFGNHLFIIQSANHRFTRYNLSGVGQYDFGSLGSGLNQFNYPTDLAYNLPYLYVCDKLNHKIKVYDIALLPVYLFSFGGLGTGDNNLNFPEGIVKFNGKIVVADSANKHIKFFDLAGNFLSKITNANFVYPTGLTNINDQVLMVIDKQGSTLYFYDTDGILINEYDTGLFFPEDAVFYDNKLYLTDSANHRIVVLNAEIVEDIPTQQIRKLTRQLYPTGRAWWMVVGGIFDKIHEGLAYSEARAYQYNVNLQNSILPDNDFFTLEDAANWESAFGMVTNLALSLTVRKEAILRKIQFPGNILARQDALYIEAQLQLAGFDVYVHENRFAADPTIPEQMGLMEMGIGEMGGEIANPNTWETIDPEDLDAIPYQMGVMEMGIGEMGGTFDSVDYTTIANYIDEIKENPYIIEDFIGESEMGTEEMGTFEMGNLGVLKEQILRATFFIGDATFPNRVEVDILRKNEFRELILKLKPAQMVGFLLVDYV